MSNSEIASIVKEWKDMTKVVMSLDELPLPKIQQLLKDTYRILTDFLKSELVPKQISELFLEMEDFLYFSSLMVEKEKSVGFYHRQEIFCIVKSLEKGFFEGKYRCDFPKLVITDILDNAFLFDFDSDNIVGYIVAFNEVKAKEI